MGYLVDKDKPDAEVVKKNEEEFSTCSLGHRWFHTGDIRQIIQPEPEPEPEPEPGDIGQII